jgi:hypothetical protein
MGLPGQDILVYSFNIKEVVTPFPPMLDCCTTLTWEEFILVSTYFFENSDLARSDSRIDTLDKLKLAMEFSNGKKTNESTVRFKSDKLKAFNDATKAEDLIVNWSEKGVTFLFRVRMNIIDHSHVPQALRSLIVSSDIPFTTFGELLILVFSSIGSERAANVHRAFRTFLNALRVTNGYNDGGVRLAVPDEWWFNHRNDLGFRKLPI